MTVSRQKFFFSIKSKLILFGLCISIVPVAVIMTAYYMHARSSLLRHQLDELSTIAALKKRHIEFFLESKKDLAEDFCSSRLIKEYLKTINRGRENKKASTKALKRYLLMDKMPIDPHLAAISVADATGRIVVSSDETLVGKNISGCEVFTQTIRKDCKEANIIPPYCNAQLGADSLFVCAPISLKNGDKIGAVINSYGMDALNEITKERTGLGRTGEFVLGQKNGDMVRFLTDLRYASDSPTGKSTTMSSAVAKPMKLALMGKDSTVITQDYRDIDVVAACQYIPSMRWGLVVKIDTSEVFASIRTMGIVALIFGIICVVVVTFAGVVFAISLSRPIKRLTDAAEQFAKGDLAYRVRTSRHDEIGVLSRSFNAMAERLAQDIAAREQVEEMLRKIGAKYRSIINTTSEGFWEVNAELETVEVNGALCKMLNYSREEMLGRKLFEFADKESFQEHAFAPADGLHKNYSIVLKTKDGRDVCTRFHTTVSKRKDGGASGFFAFVTDITELMQIEGSLAKYTLELERSNKELQDFAHVASHDLQEPLRKIIAFGDRLKTTNAAVLNEQGRDYLDRMQKASIRMQHLVEDLLQLARVTTKARPFEATDMQVVIQEVLSDLAERIRQTKGLVSVGEMPVLDADKMQMRQLFQNLIANALKFHKEGNQPCIAMKSTRVDGEFCEITVEDNGVGFDEKYLDRIFKPFERLHGRGEYEGTGMGLAICSKIAKRHGGEITARSAPGMGSTFIVKLPFHQPEKGGKKPWTTEASQS